MPIVNIYYTDDKHKDMVLSHIDELKNLVAEQLTCGDKKLDANEITIRLISTPIEGMIAEMEIEIFAHAFKDRVERQDEICRSITSRILHSLPELKDVRIWLALSELGHSW